MIPPRNEAGAPFVLQEPNGAPPRGVRVDDTYLPPCPNTPHPGCCAHIHLDTHTYTQEAVILALLPPA